VANDGVIAQNGMAFLLHIAHAHHNQHAKEPDSQAPLAGGDKEKRGENEPKNHDHESGIANWKD